MSLMKGEVQSMTSTQLIEVTLQLYSVQNQTRKIECSLICHGENGDIARYL